MSNDRNELTTGEEPLPKWSDMFGPLLGALANVLPVAIPFALLLGVHEGSKNRRKFEEIVRTLEEMRKSDTELERRLAVVETMSKEALEAADDPSSVLDGMKARDIRVGFAALTHALAADEQEMTDACVRFTANVFAGRADSQVSLAALNALPLVTALSLQALRKWSGRKHVPAAEAADRVRSGLGPEGLDALQALGLIGFQNPQTTNLGSNRIFLTAVGREIVRLTSRP